MRRFSCVAFGTLDLVEGLTDEEQQYDDAPESLPRADVIYLPGIRQDFPEFNEIRAKAHVERLLEAYLAKKRETAFKKLGCSHLLIEWLRGVAAQKGRGAQDSQ